MAFLLFNILYYLKYIIIIILNIYYRVLAQLLKGLARHYIFFWQQMDILLLKFKVV